MSEFVPVFHITLADAHERLTRRRYGQRYADTEFSASEQTFLASAISPDRDPFGYRHTDDGKALAAKFNTRMAMQVDSWKGLRTFLLREQVVAYGMTAVEGGGLVVIPASAWAGADADTHKETIRWMERGRIVGAKVFIHETSYETFLDGAVTDGGAKPAQKLTDPRPKHQGKKRGAPARFDAETMEAVASEMIASLSRRPSARQAIESARKSFRARTNSEPPGSTKWRTLINKLIAARDW